MSNTQQPTRHTAGFIVSYFVNHGSKAQHIISPRPNERHVLRTLADFIDMKCGQPKKPGVILPNTEICTVPHAQIMTSTAYSASTVIRIIKHLVANDHIICTYNKLGFPNSYQLSKSIIDFVNSDYGPPSGIKKENKESSVEEKSGKLSTELSQSIHTPPQNDRPSPPQNDRPTPPQNDILRITTNTLFNNSKDYNGVQIIAELKKRGFPIDERIVGQCETHRVDIGKNVDWLIGADPDMVLDMFESGNFKPVRKRIEALLTGAIVRAKKYEQNSGTISSFGQLH